MSDDFEFFSNPVRTRAMTIRSLLLAVLLQFSVPLLADDAYVDHKAGFVFPKTIAGFSFEKKNQYDDPRLGYGLNYWSDDGILITVIVFDLGVRDIPDGIKGFRIQQIMKESQEDVQRAVNRMIYRSAHVVEDANVFSPLFIRASYNIVRDDGIERRSHLFIRGQNRHVVKVRATGPAKKQIDTSIANFIDQLLTIIGAKRGSVPEHQ